tara:strand:- start:42 stop:347 length:306 start_codon:yes stop_codon:yes gene_type:complete
MKKSPIKILFFLLLYFTNWNGLTARSNNIPLKCDTYREKCNEAIRTLPIIRQIPTVPKTTINKPMRINVVPYKETQIKGNRYIKYKRYEDKPIERIMKVID